MKKRRKNLGSVLFTRTSFLFVFLLGFGCLLVVNLFKLQVRDYRHYQEKAIEQQTSTTVINPRRGTIYDRNGKALAVSASVETLRIDPVRVKDEETARLVSSQLAEILGMEEEKIYSLTQKKQYRDLTVARRLEKSVADRVRLFVKEQKLNCLRLVEDSKRYYPYSQFACHILGFTGTDNQGLEGLEGYFDHLLVGLPGRQIYATNAGGSEMPFEYETYIPAQNGKSLVLTIDEVIQHFTEKHLTTAYVENNIQRQAAAIVMDVNTAEILAMASVPGYDLNEPFVLTDKALTELDELTQSGATDARAKALGSMWRNKILTDGYEPGSVFKTITAAMALEEGLVGSSDRFVCHGGTQVANYYIHCWKHAGHGTETLEEGFKNSCNVVFMNLGERIGSAKFYEYVRAFGFLDATGVDLPGEALGYFHRYENFNVTELATSSFGQTFKVTPLQMITAISACVNGGYLMEPYVIKQVLDEEGNVVSQNEPTVVRQVISEKTSQKLFEMLEFVVSKGTGKNAYLAGYRIGGKTGTSEKTDDRNEEGVVDKFIASFLAVAPADDPQVAVLVILDEPEEKENTGGGAIAAPVARDIMADILPYLGVSPQYTAEELESLEKAVPGVVGLSVSEAQAKLESSGFLVALHGKKGETVTSQLPKEGKSLTNGGTVVLYTATDSTPETVEVPNVIGQIASVANRMLVDAGLNIKIAGVPPKDTVAVAVSQSPQAGQTVSPATLVTVEFRNFADVDDLGTWDETE